MQGSIDVGAKTGVLRVSSARSGVAAKEPEGSLQAGGAGMPRVRIASSSQAQETRSYTSS